MISTAFPKSKTKAHGILTLLLSSAVVSPAVAQSDVAAPTAPPPFSTTLVEQGRSANPAEAYAAATGIPLATARQRLALQEETSQLLERLLGGNIGQFVNLEIRHSPEFKVIIYTSGSVDAPTLSNLASPSLRPFLSFETIPITREQLALQRATLNRVLAAAGLRFGLQYNLQARRFELEIPEGADLAAYQRLIPPTLQSFVTITRGAIAENSQTTAYGGTWYNLDASGGLCTAGWPIRDSSGREALLTAGHCGPPFQMYFSWSSGPTLGPPSVRREINIGSQTFDYAFYLLGSNTTTRAVYVQNNTQYAGATNSVPGFVSAYYEIAQPTLAANGQYVCKNGATTGLTCGFVVDTAWSGNGFYGLVKVSQSVQPYIAETGDSGGPVFMWTSSNSQVRPMGIMKSSARINGQPCRNTSTTPSQNNTCFFTFMPLRIIRGDQPFTVNTVNGFVAP